MYNTITNILSEYPCRQSDTPPHCAPIMGMWCAHVGVSHMDIDTLVFDFSLGGERNDPPRPQTTKGFVRYTARALCFARACCEATYQRLPTLHRSDALHHKTALRKQPNKSLLR